MFSLTKPNENDYACLQNKGTLITLSNPLEGYEAFHLTGGIKQTEACHCHDFYEIYFHVRGSQYIRLENETHAMKTNEMAIIPPFSMHGVTVTDQTDSPEYAFLKLSSEKLVTLGCDQIDLNRYFQSFVTHGRVIIRLTQSEADNCLSAIDQLQENYRNNDSVDRYTRYALIHGILSVICNALRRAPVVSFASDPGNMIREVLHYINQHYTESLNISDLARHFNVSDSFLAHRFAEFTNRSVYDYILSRRIMLAREMISSDMKLNTVAFQCGFNDYSNFLRIFTKVVGKTPTEYRRSMKTQNTLQLSV